MEAVASCKDEINGVGLNAEPFLNSCNSSVSRVLLVARNGWRTVVVRSWIMEETSSSIIRTPRRTAGQG